jgi:hypothetical protein
VWDGPCVVLDQCPVSWEKSGFLDKGCCVGSFFVIFVVTIIKYLRLGSFIKERGLFSSEFWRFKDSHLVMVSCWQSPVVPQVSEDTRQRRWLYFLVPLPLVIKSSGFTHGVFTLMT